MTEIWGKRALSFLLPCNIITKSQLYIYNKVYPLIFYPFIFCFPHLKTLLFKRSPFALQKESFYSPKGVLLQSKTNPFTRQKESFCKTIGLHP